MSHHRLKHLVTVAALTLMPAIAGAQWNANTDFSGTLNPNGVWSFGRKGDYSATFNPYTLHGNYQPWLAYWDNGGLPSVMANTDNVTHSTSTIVLLSHALLLHPSSANDLSAVRFTAPSTGLFSVNSRFYGADVVGTSTDANVILNGVSLFSAYVNGYGVTQDYVANIFLNAGDVLDFAVGYGSNRDYYYDSTGLDVSIDAVNVSAAPEPASLVLMATGLAGVLGVSRRRRQRS